MNFNLVCRTCIGTDKDTIPLFKTEAADMLNYCQFWELHENDGYPNQICEQCVAVLHESYKFKQLCHQSRFILENYINKNKSDIHESETQEICFIDNINANVDTVSPQNLIDKDISKEESDSISCKTSRTRLTKCDKYSTDNKDVLQTDVKHNESKISHQSEGHTSVSPLVKNENNTTVVTGINVTEDLTAFLETKPSSPLPFSCNNCTQSFNIENDLKLHESTHTTGELKCIACEKKFATRQMLKRHIKIHMSAKPHNCQKCGKGFAESHALTKHMRRHYGIPRDKKHICKVCGQGFSEPFYLNVHIRKHTGERPLICTVCQKSFADPRSLKTHNMTHTGEKPYKCHICPKAFSQRVNLKKHVRVHTGERPYVCDNCGKSFTQSTSLDKHYRTHTGEKPYACKTCYKRFSEKGTLVHHIRTHTGEKPYVCTVCGKSFASSSELRLHDRKHLGVKKHVCDICDKDFATPSNLLIHKRSHTGERPFQCMLCQRRFTDKSSLKKHMKLHGNGKPLENEISESNEEFCFVNKVL